MTSLPRLERSSPTPLYVQIEEELRGMVESGELGPKTKAPSEIELSKRFGVSRMTARKAVDKLVGEGILVRHAGKGTFVAQPKIAPSNFSTRLSFSSAMAQLGFQVETKVLEQNVMRAPTIVARDLRLHSGALVVYLRRLRLVEGQPAAIHIAYLPATYAGILDSDLTGSLTEAISNMGIEIVDADDSVEAVLATKADARLLKITENTPLIRVQGLAYAKGAVPVRYTEALYRGDRFRLNLSHGSPNDVLLELKGATREHLFDRPN